MRPQDDNDRIAGRNWWLQVFILLASLCLAEMSLAQTGVLVQGIRFWSAPDHTRVVLDCLGRATYEVSRLGNPDRIVIDVEGGRLAETSIVEIGDSVLLRIRREARPGGARVILDLNGSRRHRSFALDGDQRRPDRIVVDVYQEQVAAEAVHRSEAVVTRVESSPPLLVVIDPGHGGLDPGAVDGALREKDIALDIARHLAELIDAREGHRSILTRSRDVTVSLADRVKIAKSTGGDIFVSIHANASESAAATGIETYVLSLEGATDREAQALADKENAADMVGLAEQDQESDDVLEILMDLRMSRVLSGSGRLAELVLGAFRRSGLIEARGVKQAEFRVLRSLAMPSMLVEVAYMTNTEDRKLLSTSTGRKQIAAYLAEGIFAFLAERK